MSVPVVRLFDPTDPAVANNYLNSGNFDNLPGDLHLSTAGFSSPREPLFYYDRLDYVAMRINNFGAEEFARLDPRFLVNTGALYSVFDEASTGLDYEGWTPGDFDRDTNVQKLYTWTTSGSPVFIEIDPASWTQLAADPFPNSGPLQTRNGKTSTQDGWYDNSTAGDGCTPLIFEARGKMILPYATVRDGGTTHTGVWVEVDLATGDGRRITASEGEAFQTGPESWFGDSMTFRKNQFVPDEDSTPVNPKGRIFRFANTLFSGSASKHYVMIVEWNPGNEAGVPQRVHGRRTLITRFGLDETNQNLQLPNEVPDIPNGAPLFFHPPTSQIIMVANGIQAIDGQRAAKENWVGFISIAAELDGLFGPSAINNVEIDDVTRVTVEARGDLGERIAGVTVQWALERASALDEILAVTPSAGETVTVQRTMDLGDNVSSPVFVEKDGTPLVESTHYTVNRSLSQITFIAPEPVGGSVYTASYRHTGDPTTPARGTLLQSSSKTDSEGRAETRIQYPDNGNLVGQIDKVSATDI